MKSIKTSPSIYSYVMNNYWHTNYKAGQEGPVTFAYCIRPHAAFNATEAAEFGTEIRQPLIVSVSDSSPQLSPLMELSSTNVLVSSIKPLAGTNNWLVHVYNPTATSQTTGLRWKNAGRVLIHRSSAAGQPMIESPISSLSRFGGSWSDRVFGQTTEERIVKGDSNEQFKQPARVGCNRTSGRTCRNKFGKLSVEPRGLARPGSKRWLHVPRNVFSRSCQLSFDCSAWHPQKLGCLTNRETVHNT
jgi:hypothetical protein